VHLQPNGGACGAVGVQVNTVLRRGLSEIEVLLAITGTFRQVD
jgi:hypothetical protein